MGSKICMMHIVSVLLILSIQLNLGEAARNHSTRWRYKRDNNGKHNGSSGRISCPPGMGPDGASNNDTAVILLVDVTKAYENVWKLQINLLMEIVNYLQGAKIGVVTISCPSEIIFTLGHYTGNEIRSKILEPHPRSTTRKGTALAFNIAAQHLYYTGTSDRRVIVLSGGESPDCVQQRSGPSEFDIANMHYFPPLLGSD
ncbi:hypothetical protein GCK32_014880 [Trichostrongylus colubriformis]|uniref:VWFA domain-containing protein n=1 Tax=Trichostrongylus colubriformis TaxID=6319 RepID=A0AAN8FLM0_TRICO